MCDKGKGGGGDHWGQVCWHSVKSQMQFLHAYTQTAVALLKRGYMFSTMSCDKGLNSLFTLGENTCSAQDYKLKQWIPMDLLTETKFVWTLEEFFFPMYGLFFSSTSAKACLPIKYKHMDFLELRLHTPVQLGVLFYQLVLNAKWRRILLIMESICFLFFSPFRFTKLMLQEFIKR